VAVVSEELEKWPESREVYERAGSPRGEPLAPIFFSLSLSLSLSLRPCRSGSQLRKYPGAYHSLTAAIAGRAAVTAERHRFQSRAKARKARFLSRR